MNKKFLCHFRSEGGSLPCGLAGWISLFERVQCALVFSRAKKKWKWKIKMLSTPQQILTASVFLYLWQILYTMYKFIKYKLKEVQQQLPKHSHGHSFFGDACIVPILSSCRCCCCCTFPTRVRKMSARARALAFSDVFSFCENFSASFLSLIFACKNESQVIIS